MKSLMIFTAILAVISTGKAGFAGSGVSGNSGGYTRGGGSGGYNGGDNNVGYTGGRGGDNNGGYQGGRSIGGGYSGEESDGGFRGGYSGGSNGGGYQDGGGGGYNNGGNFGRVNNDGGNFGGGGGGQIRKYISVHVGPDEPQFAQSKVIRVGGEPDKHVNIIFVKAPSSSSQQNTEVILPEQPQQKTLVYVLVKKQENKSNVRVRGPAPTTPSKPEVYFIRYKDNVARAAPSGPGLSNDVGNAPGSSYGVPQPNAGIPGLRVSGGGYS